VDDQDLRDAYDACDLLVHPSENESFGFVILEAWMRRKPVIGSRRCGAVASVITEGVDGFLVDGASELAASVEAVLGAPDLAQKMGEAGRKKAESRYRWSEIAERVEEVYREVASGAATGSPPTGARSGKGSPSNASDVSPTPRGRSRWSTCDQSDRSSIS